MEKREILRLDETRCLVKEEERKGYEAGLEAGFSRLYSGKEAFTGWVRLPFTQEEEELKRILEAAQDIRGKCEVLVVIGIGGSYLGARAAVEMLTHSFGPSFPRVYFAGNNLSGTYHNELLEAVSEKEICLCVISKSGTTAEPSIAFALFKAALIKKYGREEAGKRIYAITDKQRGILRQEAAEEGYVTFAVPDTIGGRYSVLTPVGLLPIAAAGIDVKEILDGARDMAALQEKEGLCGAAARLASLRNCLYSRGKLIEVFEYYEPKLQYFAEWLKQLFGESEGKNGKGIFPVALQFSADLHSMGQFLQEGNPIVFETVLQVTEGQKDLIVPKEAGELFSGKSLNAVNKAALEGVMRAHEKAEIPMLKVEIPALSPYYFGQMVYFFELTCALSGYLLGVNPFDQPGVERYKLEMRNALTNKKNDVEEIK